MSVQKIAIVPLEIWEEYEFLVHNMRQVIENDVRTIQDAYSEKLADLWKENLDLKLKIKELTTEPNSKTVLH